MTVTVVTTKVEDNKQSIAKEDGTCEASLVDYGYGTAGELLIRRLRSALEETRANLETILSFLCSDHLLIPHPQQRHESTAASASISASGEFNLKKSSVAVQTDADRQEKREEKRPRQQHCCCCCKSLNGVLELAGSHTRQRMAVLRRHYKRLYRRHRRLAKSAKRSRRRAIYLQHQHQILLESIGRQVDNVAADWARHLKGLLQQEASADPDDPGSSTSSQLDNRRHQSLYRWYSSLSLKLSWLQSSHSTVFDSLVHCIDSQRQHQ